MSQFGGGGPLPPDPPPFGQRSDWPGRSEGLPPPPPGGVSRTKGLKPGEIKAGFDLKTPGILKMAIVGSLLQFITLGIYRFWFLVDIRRQLWQRSSLAGSPFDYTGTPGEIFRGFLLALILLLPIWVSYVLGTVLLQVAQYRVIAGVLVVAAVFAFLFFIYFATYRGRRYRVSRTLWRGVRFHQTGSGLVYAVMNFGWWLLVLPTLGLSIPFARAQLERYRINHMWFGNQSFVSKASGRLMIGPYLLYYAAIFGPHVIGLALLILYAPPDFLTTIGSDLQRLARPGAAHTTPTAASTASVIALVLGAIGLVWLYTVPLLLWPVYRACELRRFIGCISFGATRFRSTFSALEIYICYIIFVLILSGVLTGIGILTGVGAGLGFGLGWVINAKAGADAGVAVGAGVFMVLSYIMLLLAFSVLRIRIFLFELTGRLITSVIVDGAEHLQDVVSQSDRVGAIGDDFAGGFDIGAI